MNTYIALLRGVNVGGKNRVVMSELKDRLTAAGLGNVSTYINSGNVIFTSDDTDTLGLAALCEQEIKQAFGVSAKVLVLSADELKHSLAQAPAWWGQDSESKHNAVFVIAPAEAHTVIEQVGEHKPEYEKIAYSGSIIFWSAPLKTFGRTKWSKIVSTAAYSHVTIRNANTARKLLALSC